MLEELSQFESLWRAYIKLDLLSKPRSSDREPTCNSMVYIESSARSIGGLEQVEMVFSVQYRSRRVILDAATWSSSSLTK